MIAMMIAALLLVQEHPDAVKPAPTVQKTPFEDKFLTFSQVILVSGAASKIVAKYSRDPNQGSATVTTQAGLATTALVIEQLTKKKMSPPVKYMVGTGNIVLGVVLGIFAHHDTAYTRAVVKGTPPPTY